MVYRSPTHGNLTPYQWYFDPLPMVYRPPYPWYFEPPIHGILNLVSCSCSTSCTRRVNLITNPVIGHE
jgi:hypothetical protein